MNPEQFILLGVMALSFVSGIGFGWVIRSIWTR